MDAIENLQNCQPGDGLAAQRHELDPPLDYTRSHDSTLTDQPIEAPEARAA